VLKGVPVEKSTVPPGVVLADGDWYYDNYPPGTAVASLDVETAPTFGVPGGGGVPAGTVPGFGSNAPAEAMGGAAPAPQQPAQTPDRNWILDLFRR